MKKRIFSLLLVLCLLTSLLPSGALALDRDGEVIDFATFLTELA